MKHVVLGIKREWGCKTKTERMTIRVDFNLEQPGTKRIVSVHEDRGFHSKTVCSDVDKVKDSAESRKFKPVYHIGSLPLRPLKPSRYSTGRLRLPNECFVPSLLGTV